MRTTNFKVKLKKKTFILAGQKLFFKYSKQLLMHLLLFYVCQNGSCNMYDSLYKCKNCFIGDVSRVLSNCKFSRFIVSVDLVLEFLLHVAVGCIEHSLDKHKDGGTVFGWNVDSTAYCQMVQNPQDRIGIKQMFCHWLHFYNDLPFSATDKDCLMNYKRLCMRSGYITNQLSWTDLLILLQ